mgnify:CR=1 FL=1
MFTFFLTFNSINVIECYKGRKKSTTAFKNLFTTVQDSSKEHRNIMLTESSSIKGTELRNLLKEALPITVINCNRASSTTSWPARNQSLSSAIATTVNAD